MSDTTKENAYQVEYDNELKAAKQNQSVMMIVTHDQTRQYGSSIDRISETVRVKRFASDKDANAFFKEIELFILSKTEM